MSDLDQHFVSVRGYDIDVEHLSYATIVVMAELGVYGGWHSLSYAAGALIVLAPVLAIAIAHAFSQVLHAHATHARRLTREEWRFAVWRQGHVVLAAAPALIILALGRMTPMGMSHVRALVLVTGTVTLIGMAALASRRAGYRGGPWLLASATGGVIGLLVISVQVFLKSK
ncbi:hypothetical protein [Nocardioides caricicola]|uniref:Uncharacterized protein n=1 Tax=Nocardioides caricicola TaxID=634770 RepID=A0ABW0N149_9ACTN